MLPFRGKYVYIWRLDNLFEGNVPAIIAELKRAGIAGVAVKIHNENVSGDYDTPAMQWFREECKVAGIGFGIWGYIYLRYVPRDEAQCALSMISKYQPDFYLIDAEHQAKYQYTRARLFANILKDTSVPVGLASYRFPHYHRELPWVELRSCCQFDSPQMYYRNSDPVAQLVASKAEFAAMTPRLPYFPAGDIYYEHGIRPSPGAVQRYLQVCKNDPDIAGTLVWSMDQGLSKTPELWKVFSEFEWPVELSAPEPIVSGQIITLSEVESGAIISIAEKLHGDQ